MADTRLLGKFERRNGEDTSWKDWRFITCAYRVAAHPPLHDLLRAENEKQPTLFCVSTSLKIKPDTVDSCITCWFSWSLSVRWIRCRVQAKENEKVQLLGGLSTNSGNLAREQFAGMLLSVRSFRFTKGARAAIEAFVRCGREYEV